MSALMGDRQDEKRFLVASIDDRVRKSMNQHLPMLRPAGEPASGCSRISETVRSTSVANALPRPTIRDS